MKKYLFKRGFSLIELLVVVAIIVILSSVILSSIYSSREKSRDAKRVSDIAQLQLALEQYFDKNRVYPSNLSDLVPVFMSSVPTAPNSATYLYYKSNNSLDYILKITLERYSEILLDSLSFNATPAGFPVTITSCSNNSTNKEYCVGPK